MLLIELDMLLDERDAAGVTTEDALEGWLAEFAPTCTGKVLVEYGPGGGNPVVELAAPDTDTLRAVLITYCGGDVEQAEWHLTLATEA